MAYTPHPENVSHDRIAALVADIKDLLGQRATFNQKLARAEESRAVVHPAVSHAGAG